MSERLLAYLSYLSEIQPEIKNQLSIFIEFEKHFFGIFKKVYRCTNVFSIYSECHPFLTRFVIRTPGLDSLRTMIHGDSKMDNFLFRRASGGSDQEEDVYESVVIDWQGVCFDLVKKGRVVCLLDSFFCLDTHSCFSQISSDVMWALYGLLKNLPDKSSTVDTFFDYSVAFYHQVMLVLLTQCATR